MKVTGARLTQRGAGCCSVELFTDSGVSGISLVDATAAPHARRIAASVLTGADPNPVTALWERMTRLAAKRAGRPVRHAIAALDIALWDLRARALGEPLWRTLGGGRPHANAHAACRDARLADGELAAWFGRMASRHGLCAGTLRASADAKSTLRRLGLMRDALAKAAPVPALMLDAGGRWPAAAAIRNIRALEKSFDLTWVEGAARGGAPRPLAQVSSGISAAVCAGANLSTVAEFRAYFERGSADVVQLDLATIGISGALVIADAAFGLELPVALRAAPGNIHAHLAGVIPGFMSMEVVDPSPSTSLYSTGVRIKGGRGIAGDTTGHGLVLS
jgi:L-alanine-DL-glutamate epimerase-like enolase superfamily enzyme